MRSTPETVLGRTAVISSSAVVSVIVGLVAAKGWAILLGPRGLGVLALMQNFVLIATLVAGWGVGNALVRAGAQALSRGDQQGFATLRRAANLIGWIAGAVAFLGILLIARPVRESVFRDQAEIFDIVLLAVAVGLGVGISICTGILGAAQRISALAKFAIATVIVSTGCLLLSAWSGGERGLAPGLLAGVALNLTVGSWIVHREVSVRGEILGVRSAARSLLVFGTPFMAAMLATTVAQIAVPVLILHTLGTESVGWYRAAAVASVYLGMFLTASAQEFYPRVTASSREQLGATIRQQVELTIALGFPVILAIFATGKYLLPLVYSPRFVPAVPVLEWQMIGDLLRFAAWPLACAVLARRGSPAYLLAESSVALVTIVGSAVAVNLIGLLGAGVAYTAAQLVYLAVCALLSRRLGVSLGRAAWLAVAAATGTALLIEPLGLTSWGGLRTPAAIALALVAGVLGARVVRSRHLNANIDPSAGHG